MKEQETDLRDLAAQLAGNVRGPKNRTVKRPHNHPAFTLADLLGLKNESKPSRGRRRSRIAPEKTWRKKTQRYRINDMRGGRK